MKISLRLTQFGFKKHCGCCHALFTFKEVSKCFIKMVGKFTVLLLMHLKRLIKCYIMDFLVNFYKKEYLLSLCVFYRIGRANCTL